MCHRGGVCHGKLTSLEPSNKRRFKFIYFEAFPAWICFKFTQVIGTIPLCIVCKYKANPCRESFRKNNLNLLLFDVGGPRDVIMADNARLGNGRHPGKF